MYLCVNMIDCAIRTSNPYNTAEHDHDRRREMKRLRSAEAAASPLVRTEGIIPADRLVIADAGLQFSLANTCFWKSVIVKEELPTTRDTLLSTRCRAGRALCGRGGSAAARSVDGTACRTSDVPSKTTGCDERATDRADSNVER